MSSEEENSTVGSPSRLKNEDISEKPFKNYSEPNNNDNDKKKYINFYFCKLSIGIIFTYIFIICSITINIVNRVIFLKYKFKFNMTFIFLQQFFCMIFFSIVAKYSKLFHKQTGVFYLFYFQNYNIFLGISISY